MDKKKIIQSIAFLLVGVGLFWWVFRDTNISDLKSQWGKINWIWVLLSILLNLFSQWLRAVRWNMLVQKIQPVRLSILFQATLLLAFANQLIPRGGEIVRLSVVSKYDKVPFSLLTGTALAERLTDLAMLLSLFILLIVWQFDNFKTILELPEITLQHNNFTLGWAIGIVVLIIIIGYWIYRTIRKNPKWKNKIISAKKNLSEGFGTIKHMQSPLWYVIITISIYICWIAMLYVLFFAFEPTDHLSFSEAAFVFGLSSMAFLLPIQSGIGAWHFLAIESLLLFGIGEPAAKAFALLSHSAVNLLFLPVGIIVVGLLPFQEQKRSDV